jgi:multidrug transporter EmrE-like cation transporter
LPHAAATLIANLAFFTAFDRAASTGRLAFVYPIAIGVSMVGMQLVSRFTLGERRTHGAALTLGASLAGVFLLAWR